MAKKESLDEEFINLYRDLGKSKGWDDLTSRIIAILYLEPEPVSMEGLATKTGYSLASISNKMKMLEPIGFIIRRCRPGSRKCYFTMEKDFVKIMKDQLLKGQKETFKMVHSRVDSMIQKHEGHDRTEEQKKKLRIIKNYYNDVQKCEKILDKLAMLLTQE